MLHQQNDKVGVLSRPQPTLHESSCWCMLDWLAWSDARLIRQ